VEARQEHDHGVDQSVDGVLSDAAVKK
jgi:hypothetical protein